MRHYQPVQQWQLRSGGSEEGGGLETKLRQPVCSHARVLDDFQTGDSVCTDCGLVLERLLGGGGGGGGGEGTAYPSFILSPFAFNDISSDGNNDNVKKRAIAKRDDSVEKKISHLLSLFQIESEHVLNEIMNIYRKIYDNRRNGDGFRKTFINQKIAFAFAICNGLARCNCPRPPKYIAKVCNLPSTRPLHDIPKSLRMGPDLLCDLEEEDYVLQEVEPYEYIDPICAHLCLPFHTASKAVELCKKLRNELRGTSQTLIAAASLYLSLEEEGIITDKLTRELCQLFGCLDLSIRKVILRLRGEEKRITKRRRHKREVLRQQRERDQKNAEAQLFHLAAPTTDGTARGCCLPNSPYCATSQHCGDQNGGSSRNQDSSQSSN